ncbi:hypothetical protein ACQKGL_18490 [Ensifer adhaerens]|uniref:hypothetical protein n=1 Tax=Ensifer adhaerens TaxID=106592 RepID=UPI003CFE8FFB
MRRDAPSLGGAQVRGADRSLGDIIDIALELARLGRSFTSLTLLAASARRNQSL